MDLSIYFLSVCCEPMNRHCETQSRQSVTSNNKFVLW